MFIGSKPYWYPCTVGKQIGIYLLSCLNQPAIKMYIFERQHCFDSYEFWQHCAILLQQLDVQHLKFTIVYPIIIVVTLCKDLLIFTLIFTYLKDKLKKKRLQFDIQDFTTTHIRIRMYLLSLTYRYRTMVNLIFVTLKKA